MTDEQKKILVVEDEQEQRELIANALAKEGFHVTMADNGETGLQAALKEHPDLILLDIIMPKMDGNVFIEKIREDAWGKNVEMIVLTNLVDPKHIVSAMEHQVYDFLIKSDWKLEDLIKKVKEKLGI